MTRPVAPRPLFPRPGLARPVLAALLFALCAASPALTAGTASAQTAAQAASDPAAMGPLAPFLPMGTAPDGWTGRVDGSVYVLENAAPGVVKYVHAGSAGGIPGLRTLSVAVRVQAAGVPGESAAGLLYRLEPGPSYYAFVLTGERQVALFRRTAGGMERMLVVGGDMVGGDTVTLGISEKSGAFALSINGREIAALSRPDDGGSVGIIAIGAGTFRFGGFRSQTQ